MTLLTDLRALALAATIEHVCTIRNAELCPRCDLDAALSPERILAMIAVIEAAKEYVAATDQSADASDHADDVAAMLRYGKADTAIRAALAALEGDK